MSRSRILQERLEFLGYDGPCRENLKELQTLLEPAFDDLLDDFFQYMQSRPETRDLIPNGETLVRARIGQKEHWLDLLFCDELTDQHYERAVQIGRAHERIGLTLSPYLGGYCFVLNRFVDLIAAKYHSDSQGQGDKIKSIQKAVFLDIDFVIESYVAAKNSAIRKILQIAEQFIDQIEQIDAEMDGIGKRLETRSNGLAQDLAHCCAQLNQLKDSLPKQAGQDLNASGRFEQLRLALAACEQNAKAISEDTKFLSHRLDKLSTEVTERKTRHRLHVGAARQDDFLSRLKKAAQVLFPDQPH